jgi:hypothetical protein
MSNKADQPRPLTIQQLSDKYPAFSRSSLRWLIHKRKANGFDQAIIRIGRRLLIDEVRFLEWIDNRREVHAA